MDSAHLVSHRADPANAGGDVRHFLEVAPAQKGLKEAGWLEDVQLDVTQFATFGADIEAPFAFHPREVLDFLSSYL